MKLSLSHVKSFITGFFIALLILTTYQVQAARESEIWVERLSSYIELTWATGRNVLINGTNRYLNFGSTSGSSGYGFRDNAGTMEVKNSGGAWGAIGGGGGGSGTVTSVAMSTPTGLTVSGSPITTSGTLALALDTGYVIPLSASTTQWAAAAASTTALTPAYIRSLFSASSPITYNNSTGAFTFSTAGDWTGTIDGNNFAGGAIGAGDILYGSSAGSIAELAIGASSTLLTSNGSTPLWVPGTSLCVAITGSASLCDGDDATGAGGGITTINGLTNSSQSFAVGTSSNVGLSIVSSGSTHTFTPTVASGYSIPLSASSTEWGSFFATPSSRISAGNGLAWSGNTLTATSTHAAVTLSGALDYITLVGQDIVRGAIDLATDISGVLADDNGGTGQSTYATGDMLYASGANTLAKRTIGSTGNVLSVVGGVPTWVATSTLGLSGGSGTVYLATSSPWTNSNLAYVTGQGTVGSVATGTLTETVTGLQFDQTRALVGGSAVLSLSAGYDIPLTASTTQWAAAAASTTALTPTYIRGLFSNTATGLTYTEATGVTSLTAGYGIPLTASTTEWSNFYTTPSTRITAGNGLAWSGNTLTATSTHAAVTLTGQNYLSLSGQQITANTIAPTNLSSSDFGSFTCNGTTCTVDNSVISNAMLTNSSVSFGGVTLSLGDTDATPAFNLVDATGLPISTGITGLGTGVATFLATPSSANLASALTNETGTGPVVFASSSMLTSPTLVSFFGTPCSGGQFLQDISDTGAFSCATPSGSGGSNWVVVSGGLRTGTTTDFAQAGYFVATTTNATSTFAGNVRINGDVVIDGDLDVQGSLGTALLATLAAALASYALYLQNTRLRPRVSSTTSASSVTPDKGSYDEYHFTAQAATLAINNPTAEIGERFVIQVKDNGTTRSVSWDTQYVGMDGSALVTATTVSKIHEFVCRKVEASKVLVSAGREA